MTTYTIKIYNQSNLNKSYVVFMEPPQVTSNGGQTPVYTNAWCTFPNLTNGGWDSVAYTQTTYAYWAHAPGVTAGVTIDSGGVMPVDTVTRDSTVFVYGEASGQPTGFQPPFPGAAQNGSFEIITGTDFTTANGLVFGMASDNGGGIPAPIATFAAAPNEKYNITPLGAVFHVADGAYAEGEILDVTAVSNNSAVVDFVGASFTSATVTQAADGVFTVKYR